MNHTRKTSLEDRRAILERLLSSPGPAPRAPLRPPQDSTPADSDNLDANLSDSDSDDHMHQVAAWPDHPPYAKPAPADSWVALHAFAAQRLAEVGVSSRMINSPWELISTITSQLYSTGESAAVADLTALPGDEPWFPRLRGHLPPVATLVDATTAPLHHVAACDVGIAVASALIAQNGTILIEGASQAELACSLMPRTSWIVVPAERIFLDVYHWLAVAKPKPDRFRVFVGGPSRTADIEKTLVVGVHGPWNVNALFFRPASLSDSSLLAPGRDTATNLQQE